MKTFFGLVLLTAAGIASAQSAAVAAPANSDSNLAADRAVTEAARTQLRGDRVEVTTDRTDLRAARAAGNMQQVAADKQQLNSALMDRDSQHAAVEADHAYTAAAAHHK